MAEPAQNEFPSEKEPNEEASRSDGAGRDFRTHNKHRKFEIFGSMAKEFVEGAGKETALKLIEWLSDNC